VRFVAGRERQAVGCAMDGQRDHHCGGEFAEAVAGSFVKVAGRACRTDVIDIFRNDEKKEIARGQRDENAPPLESCEAFRHNCKCRDAKQRAGSKADQSAKPPVRACQRRSERPADNGKEKRNDHIANRQTHFIARSLDQNRRDLKRLFLRVGRRSETELTTLRRALSFCCRSGAILSIVKPELP
jgi:hypothetical protein